MSANPWAAPESDDFAPKLAPSLRFRLVELLAVLAIMAVLVALMLPAVRTGREPRRRAQCFNNLRQITLALANYELDYGALPPAYTVDAAGRPLHSWRTLILPYLEQQALYDSIDLTKPWNDPANARALGTPLDIFRCPNVTGPRNTTTYLAVVGPGACFRPREPRRLAEITDDHGSTLTVIEGDAKDAVPWMAPLDGGERWMMGVGTAATPPHVGGRNACFVDGSARFLRDSTPAHVRWALTTVSGNDPVSADAF